MTGEIIFSSNDNKVQVQRLLKKEQIRKIAKSIYTYNLQDELSVITKRNWLVITEHFFPHCFLSHRTAFELKPSPTNVIYLTGDRNAKYKLPGLTYQVRENKLGDIHLEPFYKRLRRSNEVRAFVENLAITKTIEGEKASLDRTKIEDRLTLLYNTYDLSYLNKIRDEAKDTYNNKQSKILSDIVSGLANTKEVELKSERAKFTANKTPFDAERVKLFETLFLALQGDTYHELKSDNKLSEAWFDFSFYESYFSNYIEGSELTEEEAREVIDTGVPLSTKENDSHDILGTYKYVSNLNELKEPIQNGVEFIEEVKKIHHSIMTNRPNERPGSFKTKNNQAGNTMFVDKNMVVGTLLKGYEYLKELNSYRKKAFFACFLIAEVHPFQDGNGRTARAILNKYLIEGGNPKIIVPSIVREDYILSLRSLTHQSNPGGYIRLFNKLYNYSHYLNNEKFTKTVRTKLKNFNCFKEDLRNHRLVWDQKKYLQQIGVLKDQGISL